MTDTLQAAFGNSGLLGALGGADLGGLGPIVAGELSLATGGIAAPDGSAFASNAAMLRAMRRAAMRHGALDYDDSHPSLRSLTPTGGQSLPGQVSDRMGSAFDHDFSHVRVHIDGLAGQQSQALNAHAFTIGSHIWFGSGEWAPGTPQGDRLIAHELTHVLQHDEGRLSSSGGGGGLDVSSPTDPLEREAYGNEDRILGQLGAVDAALESDDASGLPGSVVQRISGGGAEGAGQAVGGSEPGLAAQTGALGADAFGDLGDGSAEQGGGVSGDLGGGGMAFRKEAAPAGKKKEAVASAPPTLDFGWGGRPVKVTLADGVSADMDLGSVTLPDPAAKLDIEREFPIWGPVGGEVQLKLAGSLEASAKASAKASRQESEGGARWTVEVTGSGAAVLDLSAEVSVGLYAGMPGLNVSGSAYAKAVANAKIDVSLTGTLTYDERTGWRGEVKLPLNMAADIQAEIGVKAEYETFWSGEEELGTFAFGNWVIGSAGFDVASSLGVGGGKGAQAQASVEGPWFKWGAPPEAEKVGGADVARSAAGGGAVNEEQGASHMARSAGKSLPSSVQAQMASTFGHDFSHVRVHTDAAAANAARALNANALTQGSHIYFASGQYAPGSTSGDELLAHELTHVIQHDTGRLPSGGGVSSPTDGFEREAYANEALITGGGASAESQAASVEPAIAHDPAMAALDDLGLAPDMGGAGFEPSVDGLGQLGAVAGVESYAGGTESSPADGMVLRSLAEPMRGGVRDPELDSLLSPMLPYHLVDEVSENGDPASGGSGAGGAKRSAGGSAAGSAPSGPAAAPPQSGGQSTRNAEKAEQAPTGGDQEQSEEAAAEAANQAEETEQAGSGADAAGQGELESEVASIQGVMNDEAKRLMDRINFDPAKMVEAFGAGEETESESESESEQGPDLEAAGGEEQAASPRQGAASGGSDASGGGKSRGGGGGPPMAGGSAASDQAAAPPAPIAGSNVEEKFQNFVAATPTQKAHGTGALGADLDNLAQADNAALAAATPELHAVLVGEDGGGGGKARVATPSGSANIDDAPVGQEQEAEIEETPDLGTFAGNQNVELDGAWSEDTPAEDKAREIAGSVNAIQTSDGDVTTSPGAPPPIPLSGDTNPARIDNQLSSGGSEADAGLVAANQAVISSPGAELVQPHQMDEQFNVPALEELGVPATNILDGQQSYIDMGLPDDVSGAFDELMQDKMEASLAEAQSQIDGATEIRNDERDKEIKKASDDAARQVGDAQREQERLVSEQRGKIEGKRKETIDAQQQAVADVKGQARSEHQAQMGSINARIAKDQAKITSEYAKAESKAKSEVKKGEAEAERKKKEAEKEAENKSWWDKACDFVSDCLSAIADVVNKIFDAVRSVVTAVLDAVKSLANSIIDAACSFIQGAIAAFGTLLKGLIQGLLGDIFPGLANALCEFVDLAVDWAQSKIGELAETLKKGIAALCDLIEGALNAIIGAWNAAINMALSLVEAVLTGDWSKIVLEVIEAVLKLAGISPDEFYALVGKGVDTIQAIIDDPGGFVSNCIAAVSQGFGQFSDNFTDHLQGGFVDWLTGQAGDTGIEMPESFDISGVFSIAMQVMGFTQEMLREKAVEHLGEENVEQLEFVWGFLESALEGGIEGLWEHTAEYLDDLWDDVIGAIQDWLVQKIVMKAIIKVASMFNPVGAIVQAVLTAWDLYCFVRDQISKIMGVVNSVVSGMADIVAGNYKNAADGVENALAGLVPVAIDLLAKLLGLGGIGAKIRGVIEKVQDKIWGAIDSVIEKVKGFFGGGKKKDKDGEADDKTADDDAQVAQEPDDASASEEAAGEEEKQDPKAPKLSGSWGSKQPVDYRYRSGSGVEKATVAFKGTYGLGVSDQAAFDAKWLQGDNYDNAGLASTVSSIVLKQMEQMIKGSSLMITLDALESGSHNKTFGDNAGSAVTATLRPQGLKANSVSVSKITTEIDEVVTKEEQAEEKATEGDDQAQAAQDAGEATEESGESKVDRELADSESEKGGDEDLPATVHPKLSGEFGSDGEIMYTSGKGLPYDGLGVSFKGSYLLSIADQAKFDGSWKTKGETYANKELHAYVKAFAKTVALKLIIGSGIGLDDLVTGQGTLWKGLNLRGNDDLDDRLRSQGLGSKSYRFASIYSNDFAEIAERMAVAKIRGLSPEPASSNKSVDYSGQGKVGGELDKDANGKIVGATGTGSVGGTMKIESSSESGGAATKSTSSTSANLKGSQGVGSKAGKSSSAFDAAHASETTTTSASNGVSSKSTAKSNATVSGGGTVDGEDRKSNVSVGYSTSTADEQSWEHAGATSTAKQTSDAKVSGDYARKNGKSTGALSGEVGSGSSETFKYDRGGTSVERTDTSGAKLAGSASAGGGSSKAALNGEVSRGSSEKRSWENDGVTYVKTDETGAKLTSSIGRDGDKTSAKVGGSLSSKSSDERKYDDNGVAVVRKTTSGAAVDAGLGREGDKRSANVGGSLSSGASETRTFEAGGRKVTDTAGHNAKVSSSASADGDKSKAKVGSELSAERKRSEAWTEGGVEIERTRGHSAGVNAELSEAEGKGGHKLGGTLETSDSTTRKYKEGDRDVVLTDSRSGSLGASQANDGKKTSNAVSASYGASSERSESYKRGDTSIKTTSGQSAKLSGESTGDTHKVGGSLGTTNDRKAVTTSGDVTTTHKSSNGTSLDASLAQDAEKKRTAELSLGTKRAEEIERVEKLEGGGKLTSTGKSSDETAFKVDQDGKFGLTDTQKSSASSVHQVRDGHTVKSSSEEELSKGLTNKGAEVKRSFKAVDREEVEKLDDETTITTVDGKRSGAASAGIVRDKDGKLKATAEASAQATAHSKDLSIKLGKDGEDGSLDAGYKVGDAKAEAKAEAKITKDDIKISGNANASVTLVGGHAQLRTPVFGWSMFGEDVDVEVTVGVSASVLAEAGGKIDVSVSKGSELGVNVGGGGKAFAGAKAGVEAGAKLRWKRKNDYSDALLSFAKTLGGSVGGYVAEKVSPETWKQISSVVIGSGTSDLISGKAGIEGSAGIGGEARFNLGLSGGKIQVSGALKGTVGLGAGVKTDLSIDAVDGLRFVGVLAMKGQTWLRDKVAGAADWFTRTKETVKAKILEWVEAKKEAAKAFVSDKAAYVGDKASQVGSYVSDKASAVGDWFGDTLGDLW